METRVISQNDPHCAALAAQLLQAGQLVAIPTETVYGLGANGLDEAAVAKIFEAKGRPQDNPLILHIASPAEMETICHSIPAAAYKLAEKFWPGPLTMVLPAKECVPKRTTGGLSAAPIAPSPGRSSALQAFPWLRPRPISPASLPPPPHSMCWTIMRASCR